MSSSIDANRTHPEAAAPVRTAAGHAGSGARGDLVAELRVCTPMALQHAPGSFALARHENPSNIPHDVAVLDAVEAVGRISKKWAPGRLLHVRFLDGDETMHARVEGIARTWEREANIRFAFDNSPSAEIRISFARSGSWSYIGTDALGVPVKLATMQLGAFAEMTDREEQRRVVLHEFGHALGLQHEHESPSGGVPWDRPRVYAHFRDTQDPPWDPAEVDARVLGPSARTSTNFTAFDPDSIMRYAIPEALTVGGFSVDGNDELSRADRDLVGRTWYPHPHTDLAVAHSTIVARTSQHLDLFWIAPDGAVLQCSSFDDGGLEPVSWSSPVLIAGPGSAHVGAITAVARESGHIDVFWVAPDGSVRGAWWHDGIGWSGPHAIAPAGCADPGAIAAIARQTDTVDLFWIAADGSVRTMAWHEGTAWSAPVTIAEADAAALGAVHAVARASNHVDVFWVSQDHELASAYWHEDRSWSVPFTIAGPGSVVPGSIGAVARQANHVDVFWTDAAGAIISAAWHEGTKWSAPYAVTPRNSAARPGGVVATARLSNHVDLFWVSPDGAVMSAWWHDAAGDGGAGLGSGLAAGLGALGEGWSAPFRLTAFGVAEPRSLSGVARLNGHLDLCWVAFDGAVLSTWWHDGQRWVRSFGIAGVGAAATTSSARSPVPASAPTATPTPTPVTVHVPGPGPAGP